VSLVITDAGSTPALAALRRRLSKRTGWLKPEATMPDQIVLHVGPHKTGSTALQRMMKAGRAGLAEVGCHYPTSGLRDSGHHLLVLSCEGSSGAYDPVDLISEVAGASTVIISSENLCLTPVEGLGKVRDLFAGTPIRVIYYLRRLCDLWPSHWQELVKHGQSISFAEYVMRQLLGGRHARGTDASQFEHLERLSGAFGHAAIEIIGYDALVATRTNIGTHFLRDVLGLDPAVLPGGAPLANQSMEAWQTELVRILNAIHQVRRIGPPTDMLRIRALQRLEVETPDWLSEFKELVTASRQFRLDSNTPCVAFFQRRVLEGFGEAVVGDQEAVSAAYMGPIVRKIPLFEWPLVSRERLRRALLTFHLDLVGAGQAEP
jgi:hypothetical protein